MGTHRQKKLHSIELIKSPLWLSPHSTFLIEHCRAPNTWLCLKAFCHLPASPWHLLVTLPVLGCCPRVPGLWSRLKSHRIDDSAANPVITTLFFFPLSTTLCFGQKYKDFRNTEWYETNAHRQWLSKYSENAQIFHTRLLRATIF